MTEEKIYSYKGVDYKARMKSFKPYRVQAIIYLKKYDEFEGSQFPSIAKLQAEIQKELFSNKKVNNSAIVNDAEKLNKAVTGALTDSTELLVKTQRLAKEKAMAKELFLFSDGKGNASDENVKKLLEIMLEDSESIEHDSELVDYQDYLNFIYLLWDDFFLKQNK